MKPITVIAFLLLHVVKFCSCIPGRDCGYEYHHYCDLFNEHCNEFNVCECDSGYVPIGNLCVSIARIVWGIVTPCVLIPIGIAIFCIYRRRRRARLQQMASGSYPGMVVHQAPQQYMAGGPSPQYVAGGPSPQYVAGSTPPQYVAGNPPPPYQAKY